MKEKGKIMNTVKEKKEQLTTVLHAKGLELDNEASRGGLFAIWCTNQPAL